MGMLIISPKHGRFSRLLHRIVRAFMVSLWFKDALFAMRNELEALRADKNALAIEITELRRSITTK